MKQCRLLQRAQELLPRGYRLDLKKCHLNLQGEALNGKADTLGQTRS